MQINEDVLREVEAALASVSLRLTGARQTGYLNHSWKQDEEMSKSALASLRKAMEDGKDG